MPDVQSVWKFPIPLDDQDHELRLPGGGVIVHVAEQHGEITVWATCRPDVRDGYSIRTVHVFGTGHPIPDGYEYRGTAHVGPFVWHVFERTEF